MGTYKNHGEQECLKVILFGHMKEVVFHTVAMHAPANGVKKNHQVVLEKSNNAEELWMLASLLKETCHEALPLKFKSFAYVRQEFKPGIYLT